MLSINNFTILEKIGEGHFGKVHRVLFNPKLNAFEENKVQLPFQRGEYAIKMIDLKKVQKEFTEAHVINEKEIMQKLSQGN